MTHQSKIQNLKSKISGSTRVVGVCGHGIGYTLSPAMHNAAFQACGLDYIYVAFEVAPGRAKAAVDGIRGLGLVGVNVTKPLKTEMLPYLDRVTDDAHRIGAVNTILNRSGTLVGTTTDGYGLLRALETWGVEVSGQRVVILGAGGAARAACDVCRQARAAAITVAARNRERARETAAIADAQTVSLDASELGPATRNADLIINAIPTDIPLDPTWFSDAVAVYDTRYDVAETALLRAARARGGRTANGIDMLLFQGAAAFELWTERAAPVEVMRAALIEGLRRRNFGF
ncbi:MAG: shikimate dehydrogenase [Candidatus Latescibacteria bacterium]|nr:shikimate dehydrogenase [Candidatus Latescibacterota bacterium]